MSPQDQLKIFKQGALELISDEELLAKLNEKRSLRIKYGADPSAGDLHLGHTVPLKKLRQLQELGHRVIFLVGDFTACIGDPSGQSETRPTLSEHQVKRNAETYEEQVFRILDPKKTEVRHNSEWFSKFKIEDFLNLTSKYTVARILERDDFAKRYAAKKPITVIEFLYPLLQGYDSVQVKADVEVGGTDQKFNLLVGRELQRDWKQTPQVVLTLPLIEGTDGKDKMSKSLGNHIAIQDSAEEMFGKLMSIPDPLTIRYFRYLTDLKEEDVQKIETDLTNGEAHPRDTKARLAREVVRFYHGREKAEAAERAFDKLFRSKELPDHINEITLGAHRLQDGALDIVSLLKESGLVSSKSEARRLIEQGGVQINEERVLSADQKVSLENPVVIRCG
ncbi:MAG: tyrosine--tRNA ligase, partial [Candidatus Omnitrophica bacterium]|nr:tyrosine--tRNA ligase [Candidatus Omnitrophota bacterium]